MDHSGPSLCPYLTNKNNNISTCTLANCPISDQIIYIKKLTLFIIHFCLKCQNFYIRSTKRPLHFRIKEHINTRASSFHKYLIKRKNNDNNFSIEIGTVRNVGNLRIKEALGLMSEVFTNGPEDRRSIQSRVIPKTQEMVLDAILLNTRQYKVRINGKVERSIEWSSPLPYTSVSKLLRREPSGQP